MTTAWRTKNVCKISLFDIDLFFFSASAFHKMASVASQLIEKVTAHAQSDSLEDAREICADSTYFPNKLRSPYNVLADVFVSSFIFFFFSLCL